MIEVETKLHATSLAKLITLSNRFHLKIYMACKDEGMRYLLDRLIKNDTEMMRILRYIIRNEVPDGKEKVIYLMVRILMTSRATLDKRLLEENKKFSSYGSYLVQTFPHAL